jgi:hypothetical protein
MKKNIYLFLLFSLIFAINELTFWFSMSDLELVTLDDTSLIPWFGWIITLWFLFAWLKSKIMGVVGVLAIWVFIFIGIKFVMARWNPEEFKKTWMYFIYAVIWIFAIFMAWWLVKLISSLSI